MSSIKSEKLFTFGLWEKETGETFVSGAADKICSDLIAIKLLEIVWNKIFSKSGQIKLYQC